MQRAIRSGSFTNMAPEQQVDFPGWAWNSRFTNLDRNGDIDVMRPPDSKSCGGAPQ